MSNLKAAGSKTESNLEIICPEGIRTKPEHVLFDFDGTLSLVRGGWAEIMADLAVEALEATGTDEPSEQLRRLAMDFIIELNGKPAIHQLTRLAEEVIRRHGKPRNPEEYRQEYDQRLMGRVGLRREQLKRGQVPPADLVVPGAFEFLEALVERGVHLYLASGTDHAAVVEEANLLGLPRYFGAHIYGATDTPGGFSKEKLLANLIRSERIEGRKLLSFGDGCVEIRNVKEVGGSAVAVASDEEQRSGQCDALKRLRLIEAGADVVIPDYRGRDKLLKLFWP